MAIIDREFLETLLMAYDPNIDLTEGGPVDKYLITPILERLKDDPLQLDFEEFAKSILRTRFPELAANDGGALFDLLVKPLAVILQPFYAALSVVAANQSILNWEQMSQEEVDALLANFFYSRPEQEYATGTVRIYFQSPITVEVGDGVVFYTSDGLRFLPQFTQTITSAQMALQKHGDLYYFDVAVVAEQPGDEYNVGVGEVNRMSGLAQAVKVTNLQAMTGGTARVDNFSAIEAARQSISQRSLATYYGVVNILRELVPGLRAIQAVGYGDPEMTRDVITGGSAGYPVAWGADALFIDDSLGDGKTALVKFIMTRLPDVMDGGGPWILSIRGMDTEIVELVDDYTARIADRVPVEHPRGLVTSGSDLNLTAGANYVHSPSIDFVAEDVAPGMALHILTPPSVAGYYKILQVGYGDDADHNHRLLLDRPLGQTFIGSSFEIPFGHVWFLRKRLLKFVDDETGEVHESNDQIHIGGKGDIYVAADLQQESATIESISDQQPVVFGSNLERDATVDNRVYETGTSFQQVDIGDVLHIYTGPAAGVYTVIRKDDTADNALFVDRSLPPFSGAAYRISDEIDVLLTEPKDILWQGTDLIVSAGGQQARSMDGVNFSNLGVTPGCQLKITSGQNKGIYEITGVTGTGGNILGLATATLFSESGVSYEVYRPLEAVKPPVVEVTKVEYQNDSGLVKGEVPHGQPVGAWVHGGMTNVLHGEVPAQFKRWATAESLIAIVGFVSRDLSTVPVNLVHGTTLDLTIEGTPVSMSFGTPTTIEEVVEEMNRFGPLAGRVRIQEWRGGKYIVVSMTSKFVVLSGSSSTYFQWMNQLSSGIWLNPVLTLRTTVDYSGISDPIPLDELDMFRARLELITPWGTITSWLYEREDLAGGFDNCGAYAYLPRGEERIPPAGIFEARLGYASVGTIRVRFLDPTRTEFYAPLPPYFMFRQGFGPILVPVPFDRQVTYFEDPSGRKYYPDLTFAMSVLPTADFEEGRNNGSVLPLHWFGTHDDTYTGAITGRDPVIDFRRWGIIPSDLIHVLSHPIIGTVDLSTMPSVDGLQLRLSVGQDDQLVVITFDSTITTINALVDRINETVGQEVAGIHIDGAAQYLVLESDDKLVVISDGGATDATGTILGPGYVGTETSNEEQVAVPIWDISDDGQRVGWGVMLNQSWPTWGANVDLHFRITRPACHGFTPSQMLQDDYGFYYVDVEVVSEGFGDSWNLEDGTELVVEGDRTLGWRLSSDPQSLAFSDRENLWMHLSPKFVEPGAEDDPDNYIETVGTNLVVTYTTSSAVRQVQAILSNPNYRVVCADLLAKHLRPVRVYVSLVYLGGSSANILEADIKNLIQSTPPDQTLTVQDLAELFHRRGARMLEHPIELVGLVWDESRRLYLVHSQNALSVGQRSILYPAAVVLVRQ